MKEQKGDDMKDKVPLLLFIIVALIFVPILLTANPLGANSGSTSLSLEPSVIKVPFLELEHADVISVDLDIYNIHNLKKFLFILKFDGEILEFYGKQAGDWGYSGSMSTNPLSPNMLAVSGELSAGREISGSGTFFRFAFKVLRTGSTRILLEETEIIDVDGSSIPHTVSGNRIEVLPLEVWVDGEYAELKEKYDVLSVNYSEILAKYETLNATYKTLNSSFASLQKSYNDLQTTYNSLKADHDSLKASHESLQMDHNSLKTSYEKLRSDYDGLKSSHDLLSRDYNILESKYRVISELGELGTTRSLMYIFITTTIIFIVTTIYFAKRKPKTT